MSGRRKRCISLHQVFIYPCQDWITHVKICIHVKNISIYVSRFTCTYQDPLAGTSSLITIDQLLHGSTIKYYIEVRVPTSRFAVIHQDPHIYIKITRSRVNDLLRVTECIMVSFSLESKLSNRFALRTLTFELNWATSHYWMTQFLLSLLSLEVVNSNSYSPQYYGL